MVVSIQLRIDDAWRDAAGSAVHWLPGFYPHVEVTLENDLVELRSDDHNSAGLAAIWAAALANELLLARGNTRRAAAFSTLAT
ncbi:MULTISPECIES: hypothetical protein [unclassified Sphingomonas]|jgi:hypothetical protein|uniref:hypothetical protein n=1 Tax=unclassified Sphingomonas TaxID=196159 RepID=UPI000A4BB843|nr:MULTISPECIES: hypothetical protein [unclassified Sphingomonas]